VELRGREILSGSDVELHGLRMKNINVQNGGYLAASILLALSIIVFLVPPAKELNLWTIIQTVFAAIGVELFLFGIFSKYLWKSWIFRKWLILIPNLNGTWKGQIVSTWVDPITNARPAPIPAILTIHQSLFKISCVMRTEEMTSTSFIADFVLDDDSQTKKLCYSYNSNPKQTVIERSPQHLGTMVFDINQRTRPSLCGEYWSGRKTTGNIEVEFWKKEKLNCFPKSLKNGHPVSQVRGFRS
jgi:hypothetical protein